MASGPFLMCTVAERDSAKPQTSAGVAAELEDLTVGFEFRVESPGGVLRRVNFDFLLGAALSETIQHGVEQRLAGHVLLVEQRPASSGACFVIDADVLRNLARRLGEETHHPVAEDHEAGGDFGPDDVTFQ